MKYIDTHIHLNEKDETPVNEQVSLISRQLSDLGIEKGILVHLNWQRFSIEEITSCVDKTSNLVSFVNLDPCQANAINQLSELVKTQNVKGLKLHPRFNDFSMFSVECFDLCKLAGKLGIPVLICSFPDGIFLERKLEAVQYYRLAESCPDTNFIWAHMGGHKVLDFAMLGRRLKNVYMDFSLTLLYYNNSSVISDVIFAMNNWNFERIFYGSDYPDRSLQESLNQNLALLHKHGVSETQIQKLFFKNAQSLFVK